MKHLLSSITLLLLSTLALGQVPNTFSSGETISSSKINANFAYLADSILKDNVTAMMVCRDWGIANNVDFVFGRCSATDNTTFSNDGYTGGTDSNFRTWENISLEKTLTERWLLSHTWSVSSNSINSNRSLFFFYKVSSD